METTLYKKDATGNTRIWQAKIDYMSCQLVIKHGILNGEIQTKFEDITEGKAARNIDEQLESRFNSRVNKKLDSGYVENLADLKQLAVNRLGLPRPMLAKKIQDIRDIDFRNAFIQPKFDGHRCLIAKTLNGMVAYSRNGKPIHSIPHLLEVLDRKMKIGMVLDGELYHHETPLQTISSWVRRKQENSAKLNYVIYDLITDKPYAERFKTLYDKFGIYIAITFRVESMISIHDFFEKFQDSGYEGAIIRQSKAPYEEGKRSFSLIKMKSFQDEEFKVIDINPSREGWAILTCEFDGKYFEVSAPGTFNNKFEVIENKDQYIGRFVRVEYANLTKEGKPFHPVATAWRNKYAE